MIIWAGVSTDELGMVVEHYPKVIIPKRKIQVQNVAGRSDDIVISSDAFENYEQSYSVFLDSKYIGGLEAVIPKISDWLLGNPGYHRLEDSYFPDYYRMAYVPNGQNFSSLFNEYGEGTISFNCAPEKYLKTGELPIEVPQPSNTKPAAVLYNPTAYAASPIIKFNGSTNGVQITFTNNKTNVANATVMISIDRADTPVTIDVKKHKITATIDGVETNYSSHLTGRYEDLMLMKETKISCTGVYGTEPKLTIIPRWYTI